MSLLFSCSRTWNIERCLEKGLCVRSTASGDRWEWRKLLTTEKSHKIHYQTNLVPTAIRQQVWWWRVRSAWRMWKCPERSWPIEHCSNWRMSTALGVMESEKILEIHEKKKRKSIIEAQRICEYWSKTHKYSKRRAFALRLQAVDSRERRALARLQRAKEGEQFLLCELETTAICVVSLIQHILRKTTTYKRWMWVRRLPVNKVAQSYTQSKDAWMLQRVRMSSWCKHSLRMMKEKRIWIEF